MIRNEDWRFKYDELLVAICWLIFDTQPLRIPD